MEWERYEEHARRVLDRIGEVLAMSDLETVLLDGARLAGDLEAMADSARTLTVARARTLGASWQQIGEILGVSRQAAWERYHRV